jgi:hypothetical protein
MVSRDFVTVFILLKMNKYNALHEIQNSTADITVHSPIVLCCVVLCCVVLCCVVLCCVVLCCVVLCCEVRYNYITILLLYSTFLAFGFSAIDCIICMYDAVYRTSCRLFTILTVLLFYTLFWENPVR